MGLYSAFYASLSGLSTNSNSLNVIGNNLANLNTVGFKSSQTTFQDLFGVALGANNTSGNGNPITIGLGARLGAVAQNFGQGSFQSTSSVTDMGIEGAGFFTVRQQTGVQAYTRAGSFTVDKTGFLVDPNGANVMGWNRNATGVIDTTVPVGLVQIDTAVTNPPRATDTFSLSANLDANSPITPLAGSSFTSPIQIFDSLGGSHTLIETYTKTATGAWSYAITTDDSSVLPATIASGTLTFDTSGNLATINGLAPIPANNPVIATFAWGNGATTPATTWELIDADGNSSISQYASPSSTSNTVQNGYGAGTIRSLTVDQDGVIIGNFSNGQTVPLSQVAISLFNNVQGLAKTGQNYWSETLASGSASIGLSNQGGRGSTLGANLELSNVDVAEEFTKLIVSQRGYQANSRIVTTTDTLLEETLNLKR